MSKIVVLASQVKSDFDGRDVTTKWITFYLLWTGVGFRVTFTFSPGTDKAIGLVERWVPIGWTEVVSNIDIELPAGKGKGNPPNPKDDLSVWTPILEKPVHLAYELSSQEEK